MANFPSNFTTLLGSQSTSTSGPWFVGDFRLVSISFQSKASLGASRFTIYGSNADGLQNTTDFTSNPSLSTGWSIVSGVNMVGLASSTGGPGVVVLDPPGHRWIRVSVDPPTQSAASYTTIQVTGVRF